MSFFNSAQARTFGEIAACLFPSKGRISGALDHAEIAGASTEVRRLLRSIGLLSEITGTPLFQTEARNFLETMAAHSAFDSIAQLAQHVPMRRRVAALSAIIDGTTPGEGEAKVVSSFDLTDDALALLKATAIIVQSAEMASALSNQGINFLLGQLRNALGPATDLAFFRAILAGVSAEPASGTDAEAFRQDVAAALKRLGLGAGSRPVIVVDADQAVDLAFMQDFAGSQAFPDMSVSGGVISGTPVFVSDGVPLSADVSPGTRQIVVLDAQGLALDTGEVALAPAAEAVLSIDGEEVSLWQRNLLALRAERMFGAALARAEAVQVISGANYSTDSSTSP